MKARFDWKLHLKRLFPVYVSLLVTLPLLGSFMVNWKNKPKDKEVFSVVIAAELSDRAKFFTETKERLGDDILEFNLWGSPYKDNFLENMSAPILMSDILIFPKQALENLNANSFITFEEDDAFASSADWIVDGEHRGLQIYDGKDGYLKESIQYTEEPYYVLVRKESAHAKHWGYGETDHVLDILEAWFSK